MEIKLHLDEQNFNDTPTKTQLSNLLGDLVDFQTKLGGLLLAKGDYAITDQSLASLLNTTVQLRAVKDLFDGVSRAGMAEPQPQNVTPMQPRRG